MDVYIQKANFKDALISKNMNLVACKKLFLEFDWDNELKLSKQLEDAQEENCAVNIIINKNKHYMLQIMLYNSEKKSEKYEYEASFHYTSKHKFWGLIPLSANKVDSITVKNQSDAITKIEQFYDNNMAYFMNLIQQSKIDDRY